MDGQPRERRFAKMLLAALVLAIPACGLASDNPLSDPLKAKADEELFGAWEDPKPDPNAFCKTLAFETLTLPGYPPGAMKVTIIPRDPDSRPKFLVCFSTELNGKKFAYHCGPWVEDLKQLPTWDKLSVNGYGIYKYEVSAKWLTFSGAAPVPLAKAVEAGKLKGKWAGGPYYSYIQLTDTTENLAKFLSSDVGDPVFVKEAVLKRVK